jgi:hypothetical protein
MDSPTVRQFYKAHIMAALIGNMSEDESKNLRVKPDMRKAFCHDAGSIADAMLAEDLVAHARLEKHADTSPPLAGHGLSGSHLEHTERK